jgi:hypothetical protein
VVLEKIVVYDPAEEERAAGLLPPMIFSEVMRDLVRLAP